MAQSDQLEAAKSPDTTPFDYIVVGSGAGGGPLAARMALEGRTVLVLEAGVDPATGKSFDDPKLQPEDGRAAIAKEIYAVPAFHAASTEDKDVSWKFSVRHFTDDKSQRRDTKYRRGLDRSAGDPKCRHKGGIFYPRAAALGGCTAHHAMVIVRPNDCDWDRIAELTGDDSWRSGKMQGYFAKLENCLYYKVYKGFIGKILGGALRVLQWLYTQIDPRGQLDSLGHGSAGWQTTSFIDPLVVAGIAKSDVPFLSLLWDVVRYALRSRGERTRLARALAWLQVARFLDPNMRSADANARQGLLSLVPIGTDGRCRYGLREHLLAVATDHPDRLVLLMAAHVTRVVFAETMDKGVPRAVGVEVAKGAHLYRASPRFNERNATGPRVTYFARREVILAGGAFNTPQLLMLSGIGDRNQLAEHKIAGPRDKAGRPVAMPVHLPGVGANLRDRYEVSVISRANREFATLGGVTFRPNSESDVALKQWREKGTGLYTTNGVALAMLVSSKGNLGKNPPDLFLLGVPAAFRGYYPGWSEDALHSKVRGKSEERKLWSWAILKAYTDNREGTVRLFSDNPFDTPVIDFRSFSGEGGERDLAALCEAVNKVRDINSQIGVLEDEIWPDKKKNLEDWVRDEAWGHHACGTCRIGKDPWRSDTGTLTDTGAVLDSAFRVHGVHGLRVVDASIFPEIPGYFLVTSVFMASEKAADTLLASEPDYPDALERAEAAAVHARRKCAGLGGIGTTAAPDSLPQDTVGVALSGGGIRSATFCLGVLQAMAACGKLRRVDLLSTVSGGGYIGGFLGRLYTRASNSDGKAVAKVEEILSKGDSPELWWLRRNADYANSAGRADLETNLAIIVRNLLAVHAAVAALLFGLFGGLRWLADEVPRNLIPEITVGWFDVSFWWWVPLLVLAAVIVPLAVGYWLARGAGRRSEVPPLLVWLLLLGSAVYGLGVPGGTAWSGAAIGVLLTAWVFKEIGTRRVGAARDGQPKAWSSGVPMPKRADWTLLRNRFTRALGVALLVFLGSSLWVVLDTLARTAASQKMVPMTQWSMLGFSLIVIAIRILASRWSQQKVVPQDGGWFETLRSAAVNGLGFALAAVLLFFIDVLAHLAFNASRPVGLWTMATAISTSVIAGRWLAFLNLTSLQQSYAQKLVRTFLGATTDARVRPAGLSAPLPVEVASPDDDLFFDEYHPEKEGGPLHLINVCVNDTVVSESGRQLRADKCLPMCVGPVGVSVGRRYHAIWEAGTAGDSGGGGVPLRRYRVPRKLIESGTRQVARPRFVAPEPDAFRVLARPLPVAPDPNAFHLLARSDGSLPAVQRLRLGQWLSISGAAIAPGTGRFTTVAQSLFLGLTNLRLGYWWDSGIRASQRPSRYPPSLWKRLKTLPASVFRMQSTLLNEWRGYFAGPAERLWYVSDGGHFEDTGLYELIRRRLPFIIAIDGGQDPEYKFDTLAILSRQVRMDFGAEIEWLNGFQMKDVPQWIGDFFNASAVSPEARLQREGASCSMLGRITYQRDRAQTSWILLVKATLAPTLPLDVRNYADRHPAFPNEPTAQQFFTDDQWESYRKLGQCVGATIFGTP